MLTALLSSRSITKPQFAQRYVRMPQRHVFFMLTDMTRLRRIAFTDNMQFFPKAQTLVCKHLHKAVETPIIIHHAITYLPLAPFFVGLVLLLLDDHLPLGKIANDHSSFSQCASDKMRGFMQTVSLFAAFLFSHALVDLREMDIAPRFFLTLSRLERILSSCLLYQR